MAVWQWHPAGVLDVLAGNTKFTGAEYGITGSFKCLLLTSGFTVDPTNRYLSRSTIFGEVIGSGYTAGGVAVGNSTAYNEYLNTITLTFADASWYPGTFTARTAVIYHNTTGGAPEFPLAWLTLPEDRSCYQSIFKITGPILKIGLNP